MTEKLVKADYEIEGVPYELWTETGLREPNWWLMFGGVEQDAAQFTEPQLRQVDRYVEDWRAPGGH